MVKIFWSESMTRFVNHHSCWPSFKALYEALNRAKMYLPDGFTVHESQVDADEGSEVCNLHQPEFHDKQDRVPSWRLKEVENKQKEKDEERQELREDASNATFLHRSFPSLQVRFQ